MKSRNLFWITIILILATVIVVLLGKQYNWFNKTEYAAVYLSTGELYFGQKSGLFSIKLDNSWLLNKDDKGQYKLQEFKAAVWKPVGPMNISKDKIIFWTAIDESSDIAKLVKGEKKASDIPQATSSQISP
jgi:hypothetical protein